MKIENPIGEATAYDKKRELEQKAPLSWLKSVSAFANTEGGTKYDVKKLRTAKLIRFVGNPKSGNWEVLQ